MNYPEFQESSSKKKRMAIVSEEVIKDGFIRVTQPLSLYNNFDGIPDQVLQNACARGTKVHRLAELHALGEYFPDPADDSFGYLNSFRRWFDMYVDECILIEKRLYADVSKITGAIDLVCTIRGSQEHVIVDYKTPATPSKTWPLQLAAYQYLYNSIKPSDQKTATRRIALRLRKDGKPPIIHEYTSESDLDLYCSALKIWRYFNN